jgi:hypothetical protein
VDLFPAPVFPAYPASLLMPIATSDPDLLDETCQNFCVQMIERRPDRKYVGSKGSKQVFLRWVLIYTHWATVRGRGPLSLQGGFDFNAIAAAGGDLAMPAEELELVVIIRKWMAELPPAERAAVTETLNSLPCNCPSPDVHYVRNSRGLARLFQKAAAAGVIESGSGGRRRRLPRCPRKRRPNVRVVRRMGQRFACQVSRPVPDSVEVQ